MSKEFTMRRDGAFRTAILTRLDAWRRAEDDQFATRRSRKLSAGFGRRCELQLNYKRYYEHGDANVTMDMELQSPSTPPTVRGYCPPTTVSQLPNRFSLQQKCRVFGRQQFERFRAMEHHPLEEGNETSSELSQAACLPTTTRRVDAGLRCDSTNQDKNGNYHP